MLDQEGDGGDEGEDGEGDNGDDDSDSEYTLLPILSRLLLILRDIEKRSRSCRLVLPRLWPLRD